MAGGRGDLGPCVLKVTVRSPPGEVVAEQQVRIEPSKEKRFRIQIRDPMPWSPEEPNLYRLDAELLCGDQVVDALSERIGLVSLSTKGKQFLINGEPYYIRGTGDFHCCPETGSPDTDRDRWRTKLGNLRKFGYNQVRCQSFAPTPEYLDVADEVGLIIQSEMGILGGWSGHSPWHIYAWPQPEPAYKDKLRRQWDLTVMRDVNHPSAAIYCMSNELGKDTLYRRTAWQSYRDTKSIKPSSMVIWTDGGYSPKLPADFVNAEAGIDAECNMPVIQHEFRWWSAYPDVGLHERFGDALRPYAMEILQGNARSEGVTALLPAIVESTQRLQYTESRTKLEACRRDNRTLAGISHFTAMDIGFSPQGILNDFCEEKVTDPERWLRTWGDTVILMDKGFDDRVMVPAEVLETTLFASDFSHPPLSRPSLHWELEVGGSTASSGAVPYRHLPYRTKRAGKISVEMPRVAEPTRASLRAMLKEGDRAYDNEWDFWIFPDQAEIPDSAVIYRSTAVRWLRGLEGVGRHKATDPIPPSAIVLSDVLDQNLLDHMLGGGRVLLAATEGLVRVLTSHWGSSHGKYFFLPPANYPPYESSQSGSMVVDHPILGGLPHDGYADLQLFRPIAKSPPIDLRPLGGWSVKPIIRALSSYHVFHPLTYLVEFSVGKGALIICALDLNQRWPESRYLLSSMLKHAESKAFKPWNDMGSDTQEWILRTTGWR
jgi:hypothetical protein